MFKTTYAFSNRIHGGITFHAHSYSITHLTLLHCIQNIEKINSKASLNILNENTYF